MFLDRYDFKSDLYVDENLYSSEDVYIPKIAESKDNDTTYNKFDNKSHKSSEYKSLNVRELKEVDSKEYAFGNGDSDVYLSMFNTSYEDEQDQDAKQEESDNNSLYDTQSKIVESLRSDTKEEMNLTQRKVWNQAVLDRNKEILESKGIYSGSYESKESSNVGFVTESIKDENQSYYQSGKDYKSTDDNKSEGNAEDAEAYDDEDEEDYDDEDDDEDEEEDYGDDDDENRLGNMTMSAGLMKLLGMETSEPSESETIDWVPPDKAGLDNSEVLIKKPLSMIEPAQGPQINKFDTEDKSDAPLPSSSFNPSSSGPSFSNLGMSMQSEQKDYYMSNFDNNSSVQTNYTPLANATFASSSFNPSSSGPSFSNPGMSMQSEQKDYNITNLSSYTMPYPSDAKLFQTYDNNSVDISESFGNFNN